MTRKDYVLLAAAVKEARSDMVDHPGRLAGAAQTARYVARALRMDNPRFDRQRFLDACGVGE